MKTSHEMMTSFIGILLALAVQPVVPFSASLPSKTILSPRRINHSKNAVIFAWRDDDGELYRDTHQLNKARTDIRNFLTQRAFQSFIYLLINCRDSATVRWLEKKYDFENLDNYHGTGAFNLTKYPEWDSMLVDLLQQPPDVMIVSAKRRGRGQGGWSKKNPYLEERFVDFEIDIDPPSLVSRIISVRDQIAGEWTADLETLRLVNEMILDSYYTTQGTQREEESKGQKFEKDRRESEEDDDDFMDTASMTAPYSGGSFDNTNKPSKIAYDRTNMMILYNSIVDDGRASSPFRKGSFDLLGLLATQESIHRVLRNYQKAGNERDVSFQWFREFYVSRVSKFFDGSQNFGRADDFLEELLLTAPAMKEIDGKLGLIDPMRIAEDIITMRTEVVQDWKDIMLDVPAKDHATLRRHVLAIQMGKRLDETPTPEKAFEDGFQ